MIYIFHITITSVEKEDLRKHYNNSIHTKSEDKKSLHIDK